MKKYVFPEIQITIFDAEDIITASGTGSSYKLTYGGSTDTQVIGSVKFSDITQ